MNAQKASVCICLFTLAVVGLQLSACKGPDPVGIQVGEALDSGFAAIRPDAELGLRVRSEPLLAQAAGVPLITPTAAQFAKDTLDYHQAVIDAAKERALGTQGIVVPAPPK